MAVPSESRREVYGGRVAASIHMSQLYGIGGEGGNGTFTQISSAQGN